MNIAEAITFILKNRGHAVLQDFLKNDIASVIGQIISNGAKIFRDIKLKTLPGEMVSSLSETGRLIRVLPARLKAGVVQFQNDMLTELDLLKDPKEKTIFFLKVLGILTSSSVTTFNNIKNTGKSLSPKALNFRSVFARFLLAEVVLRTTRLLALRLLTELDKEVTNTEDIEHLRYFRRVLSGDDEAEALSVSENDPAFRITEKLRKTILKGDDEV